MNKHKLHNPTSSLAKPSNQFIKAFTEKADSDDDRRIDAHKLFNCFTEGVIKLHKRFVR